MTKHAPLKISKTNPAKACAKISQPSLNIAEISHITQEDFLSQLRDILARYDHDNDGLLSEHEWEQVAQDLGTPSCQDDVN